MTKRNNIQILYFISSNINNTHCRKDNFIIHIISVNRKNNFLYSLVCQSIEKLIILTNTLKNRPKISNFNRNINN